MKKQIRYSLIVLFSLFLLWYYFALPKQLFTKPMSTVVYDENGELLGAHIAKDGQWRFEMTSTVNPKFEECILAYEDNRFRSHIGVDPIALIRAIRSNFSAGKIKSGASTITMQTIRLHQDNPERTYWEKFKEIILATRLEWRCSKQEILQYYSANAPFGGNIVGIDAAAWKYFGRSQERLSWSEAATLAVLPNSPALVHPGRNRLRLEQKRNSVLLDLLKAERIDSLTYELSILEPLPEKPYPIPLIAPHLMFRHLSVSNARSHVVHSTLNKNAQKKAQEIVDRNSANLASNGVLHAAALVLENATGEIKAYIGNSGSFTAGEQRMVNMIHAPRSTGSILKPLLYASAMNYGEITPLELLEDAPVQYGSYSPKNYTKMYGGVISAKQMVSKSLNVPAVNLLAKLGVSRFHTLLKQYGMTSLHAAPNHYGLSLILGGAEVTMWDLGKMYLAFAQKNGLATNQNFTIHYDRSDTTKTDFSNYPDCGVIWKTFEAMNELSRPGAEASWKRYSSAKKVAWKTGTSFGGRDAWAVGVSKDYTYVVWTGNADGTGKPNLTGYQSSAPILFELVHLFQTENTWFSEPKDDLDVERICKQSGMRASKHCTEHLYESIPKSSGKTSLCTYCKTFFLDSSRTWIVNDEAYPVHLKKKIAQFILPPLSAYYYKIKHPDYIDLPPVKGAVQVSTFKIIYPTHQSSLYLPHFTNEERAQVLFRAVASKKDAVLYWHINDKFVGRTKNEHEFKKVLESGDYCLSVIDQFGQKEVLTFTIL